MLIPRDQFSANPTNGTIINQEGQKKFENSLNQFEDKLKSDKEFISYLSVLLIILILIPLFVYLKYGIKGRWGIFLNTYGFIGVIIAGIAFFISIDSRADNTLNSFFLSFCLILISIFCWKKTKDIKGGISTRWSWGGWNGGNGGNGGNG